MSGFKDRMIEAFERGECGYSESYDYVRERMADRADLERKSRKENGDESQTGDSSADGATGIRE